MSGINVLSKKIVFNITFHHQIDILKFHLTNLFNWSCSQNMEYVITSAHKENLKEIAKYVAETHPIQKVECVFVPEDHGYNLGTIMNVVCGIRYIHQNKSFDFIVNVEGDNMFYYEDRFLKIINEMGIQNKHLLLIEEGYGKELHTNFPQLNLPHYFHFTTLNIFSKEYIDNHFPHDVYKNITDIRWSGRPGTPYEIYMGLATIIKNNLTQENQMEFYNNKGLRLDYDRNANPLNWSEPDNMVPEKFLKWGIINAPTTAGGSIDADWTRLIQFINHYTPLKEKYD